jgi:hypothetical protein
MTQRRTIRKRFRAGAETLPAASRAFAVSRCSIAIGKTLSGSRERRQGEESATFTAPDFRASAARAITSLKRSAAASGRKRSWSQGKAAGRLLGKYRKYAGASEPVRR